MLKVYLITVVLILSHVNDCCIPSSKPLSLMLPFSDRLLSAWCACCLLVSVGKPVQQNFPSVGVGAGLCYQSYRNCWLSRCWFSREMGSVFISAVVTGDNIVRCRCCRCRAVGECRSNNLLGFCGVMPSPGTTALTGQPKAYTAENKLQGKR